VPEKYHEQVFVRPGPQPVGIIETGNDLHVYVYEGDSIEQPTSEFDIAIYSNGPYDAMGYDAAHFYPETHQCHQQLAYAGQAYNQHFGAYQERYYHQMQFPSNGEWHGQEKYLQQQQQQQWSQDQQGNYYQASPDHYSHDVQAQNIYQGQQQHWVEQPQQGSSYCGQEWEQQQWVDEHQQQQQYWRAPQHRRGRRQFSRHQRPANGYYAQGRYKTEGAGVGKC